MPLRDLQNQPASLMLARSLAVTSYLHLELKVKVIETKDSKVQIFKRQVRRVERERVESGMVLEAFFTLYRRW